MRLFGGHANYPVRVKFIDHIKCLCTKLTWCTNPAKLCSSHYKNSFKSFFHGDTLMNRYYLQSKCSK